jgi:hypothetical protein
MLGYRYPFVRFLDRESSRNTAAGNRCSMADQNIAATDEVTVVRTVSTGAAFG